MKLYLTDPSHLNANFADEEGQVLYRVKSTPKWSPKTSKISRRIEVPPLQQLPLTSTWSRQSQGDGSWEESPGAVSESVLQTVDEEVGTQEANSLTSSSSHTRPESIIDLDNRFAHLATLDYHILSTHARMRFGGEDFLVDKWFRKGDKGRFGKDRIFTGPDGVEYKWILGQRVPELFKVENNEPVVTVIRAKPGWFKQRQPLILEIFPNGEHMMDLIVVTFVYIERVRHGAKG